jgi:hypothetical protein
MIANNMDVLVGALRDALNAVRSDGRVPRPVASRVRAAVLEQRRRRAEPPAQEIVDALPAFETLSDDARQSLYAVVRRDDEWSMWLRRAKWRQALTRAARTLALKIPGRYLRLRRLLDLGESLFLFWQARLAHELYRVWLGLRGWTAREPTLAATLRIAGLDARVIAASYLRDTPQPLDTAAYWHNPVDHTTVGVIVGIDFIVNEEGVWFVESNLNVGLTEERSRLYETDPFVDNLVRFARQNGYTSLVYLACNDYGVDRIMAAAIERAALASGLRATILEDRYAPQCHFAQTFEVPPLAERTLVVRGKMFHTALDAVFHNKTLSLHALESYQRALHDPEVRLPLTGAHSMPETLRMDGPFPNVVYKFPERDQGQGVMFLKVPSLARAQAILSDPIEMNRHSVANVWTKLRYRLKLEEQTGIFQAYVPSFLLEGRRLSIARAHVLATPVGLAFLSAHRVVSNLPVPESLAEGLVEDATPYIVNYSLDSEHAPMPLDEEVRVSKAALGVVRALCWAVQSHFQTSPAETDSGQRRRDRLA